MSLRPAAGMLALALALAVLGVDAADPERGRGLYEASCGGCHGTGVHERSSRKARSFEELQQQIRRWRAAAGVGWGTAEVDDVTVYLNRRFYKFPCPPDLCPAETARGATAP